jgi:hypothetical protein
VCFSIVRTPAASQFKPFRARNAAASLFPNIPGDVPALDGYLFVSPRRDAFVSPRRDAAAGAKRGGSGEFFDHWLHNQYNGICDQRIAMKLP